MGWWRRWRGGSVPAPEGMAAGEAKAAITDPAQLWLEVYGSRAARSGVTVNARTALQAMAVLACVRVLAEGVAQVPLRLMRTAAGGRGTEPATDHQLYRVLNRRPNPWQTSFEFRETLVSHAVLTGNGFAFVNRVREGVVYQLIPLLPQQVTIRRPKEREAPEYEWRPSLGTPIALRRDQVLHLRGPSWDSIVGLDAVVLAREAIGLALAAEEHSAMLFGNGGRPSGVLTTAAALKQEQIEQIKDEWARVHGGGNRYGTAVLTGDMKFQSLVMNSVDAQHHETRRQQVEEICRAFRVFPQMVGYSDKTSTYASAEQFFIAHVVHSLGPWFERLEQAFERDLLTEAELESGLFVHCAVQGLLRGDATSRANLYSRGILDGWMTRNEARALEDLNPLPGLDEPLRPLNMGPGSVPPPPETAPPAEPEEDDDGSA